MADTVTILGQQLDRRVLIYGGGAAGVFVLWRWWQVRQGAAENGGSDTAPAADSGDSWTTDTAPGGIAVRTVPAGQTDSNGDEFSTPRSDAEWSQAAVDYMGTIGFDPATIAAALGAFLGGQTLSSAQAGYVRTVIAAFGRPPQHPETPIKVAATPAPSTPPTRPTTPAKPAPKPAPKQTKTHTVVKGETLSGIARKYHTTVSRLVQLNHIKNPDRIYAGQKLVIG